MTSKGRPDFSSGEKRSNKLLRAARKYNHDNHTHFKHYNKRDHTNITVAPFEVPMTKNTDGKDYRVFYETKKQLVVSLIKKSATVKELLVVINADPNLQMITHGLNGMSSKNPQHYVSNMLQKLVKEGRLLCMYEREGNNDAKKSVSHHWRYIRKDNHIMRTYYILEETRRGICHACVRIVRACLPFINR